MIHIFHINFSQEHIKVGLPFLFHIQRTEKISLNYWKAEQGISKIFNPLTEFLTKLLEQQNKVAALKENILMKKEKKRKKPHSKTNQYET